MRNITQYKYSLLFEATEKIIFSLKKLVNIWMRDAAIFFYSERAPGFEDV